MFLVIFKNLKEFKATDFEKCKKHCLTQKSLLFEMWRTPDPDLDPSTGETHGPRQYMPYHDVEGNIRECTAPAPVQCFIPLLFRNAGSVDATHSMSAGARRGEGSGSQRQSDLSEWWARERTSSGARAPSLGHRICSRIDWTNWNLWTLWRKREPRSEDESSSSHRGVLESFCSLIQKRRQHSTCTQCDYREWKICLASFTFSEMFTCRGTIPRHGRRARRKSRRALLVGGPGPRPI